MKAPPPFCAAWTGNRKKLPRTMALPATATARRLYLGIQRAVRDETAQTDEADLWRLAAVLMPEATAEEIDALTPTMIGVVTRLAAGGIEEVERIIAEGKGKDPVASPAQPSTTTSPTP